MPDVSPLDALEALECEARAALADARSPTALEAWRNRYLARKGAVNDAFARLAEVPAAEKKAYGQRANALKQALTALHEAARAAPAADPSASLRAGSARPAPGASRFDSSLPGEPAPLGSEHPLAVTIRELCELFGRLGFAVVQGPEVEDVFHNFDALNTPREHPARDPSDNFYLTNGRLLRSQTSTVQIRTMERLRPPLRVVAPGRVYRPDEADASHYYMFHQLEGLMVAEDVTFVDLKAVLRLFVAEYYREPLPVRFRPHYFPFTEPSAELDVQCRACRGAGCKTCKHAGWLELLGCGMVDPAVFQAVGYEPDRYTGFAFGMGIERLTMMKYGLSDLRFFFDHDEEVVREP